MTEEMKHVLMVARDDKLEALRMAAGLTLLDDVVRVAVIGELDESSEDVQMQLEALEFADVSLDRLGDDAAGVRALAGMMIESDTVFMI
jgi:hypothetical protein